MKLALAPLILSSDVCYLFYAIYKIVFVGSCSALHTLQVKLLHKLATVKGNDKFNMIAKLMDEASLNEKVTWFVKTSYFFYYYCQ